MHTVRLHVFAALLAAVGAAACGSSSTTSTAPSTVPRCGVTLASTDLTVPAAGGSGTLAITTARECAWTANSTSSWLTLRGTPSGQGDGVVEYVAAANSDPATRRGVIELNDQRANITQSAAECVLQLPESSGSFSQAGGSGTIAVRASSALCSWTAAADASWISIRSGATGAGNGSVAFDVAAATGPPRTATITVAGLRYSVTQSQGCSYAITPSIYAPGSAGGQTNVTVTATAGCPWTAASNVPWAAVVDGASGTGSGTARIVVEPTNGPARSGSVLIAGQLLAITQTGECTLSVEPLAHTFGAQGGSGSSAISGGASCAWNATTDVPWITLTGATSGLDAGSLAFSVAPGGGSARTGTISVAGARITVSQAAACSSTIAPRDRQVDAAGGEVTVTVTSTPGCAWTTASPVSWITVASGASGSGDGMVRLTVAPLATGSRTGTVTIAGQAFTVTQSAAACSFSLSQTSGTVAAGGGTGSVGVTAGSGCAWTASSSASWLTISAGASGSGNGTVQYSAAANNTGAARSATLTIAGQTFTVNQAGSCTFSVNPTTIPVAPRSGTGSVAVTAGAGCAWTAASNAPWLTVTQGASGSGSGTVNFTTATNSGTARSGTLTVAGQTVTVNQSCGGSVAPAARAADAKGDNSSFNVVAPAGCAWTAVADVPWLTVSFGNSGNGTGMVNYGVAANTTNAARSGTITAAGATFTVNQAR